MLREEHIDGYTENQKKNNKQIVKSSARRDAELKMKSQKLNECYT